MAAELGFEPRMNESESLVLPLHHSAIYGTSMGTRTPVFAVRGQRLNRLTMEAYVAAELGFEPRMNESESLVLPLHHSATSNSASLSGSYLFR